MDAAAEVVISAAPETVWSVLADTDNYSSFDSGIARVVGGPLSDDRFVPEVNRRGDEVRLRPVRLLLYSVEDGDRGRLFRVSEYSPPRFMVWSERSSFGLVVRERFFLVEAEGLASRFSLSQRTSGRLGRFMSRWEPDLAAAFDRFCAGLRTMAETFEAVRQERRNR